MLTCGFIFKLTSHKRKSFGLLGVGLVVGALIVRPNLLCRINKNLKRFTYVISLCHISNTCFVNFVQINCDIVVLSEELTKITQHFFIQKPAYKRCILSVLVKHSEQDYHVNQCEIQ